MLAGLAEKFRPRQEKSGIFFSSRFVSSFWLERLPTDFLFSRVRSVLTSSGEKEHFFEELNCSLDI